MMDAIHLFYITIAVSIAVVTSDENIVIGDESSRIFYVTPAFHETDVYFIETFDNKNDFLRSWIKSEAKKDTTDEALSKYDGEWDVEPAMKDALPGDMGMILKSKAKHAALSSRLKKPFVFSDQPLIVQYEVLLQDGQECGGAYLKLLTDDKNFANLKKFHDKTPYTIMFGPDKCGNEHKLHFIFRHKNPITGITEEKHAKKPTERLDDNFVDRKPHLYRLVVEPGNTFKVFVDHNLVNSGSLLEDFFPPVNPPAEIHDPNDKKPADWDDREKIPDASATKPDDWDEDAPPTIEDPVATRPEGWLDDEPLDIRDPLAEKPEDWNEKIDGEWEAPLVPNPACEEAPGCGKWTPPLINNPEYKGKWYPPMIDNPNYQGKWTPRLIPNPDYFEDKNPFKMASIGAVGFELWSMSPNILFDNIIITSKVEIADKLAAQTFDLKKRLMEMDADTFVNRFVNYTNKHPWLWALYVVVLLIPITLIVVFCFGSSKEKEQFIADAKRKKTDEAEPDDDKTDGQIGLVDDEIGNCSSDLSVEEGQLSNEVVLPDSTEENEHVTEEAHDSDDQYSAVMSGEIQDDENISVNENVESESTTRSNEELHDPSLRRRCQRID